MINFRAFWQLTICRFREFQREPEIIFWVFFFPLLLAMGLGIAFRDHPPEKTFAAILNNAEASALLEKLRDDATLHLELMEPAQAKTALRLGKVALVIIPGDPYEYWYDPARPDSLMARSTVDAALQTASGRKNPLPTHDKTFNEPGGRYIDFLIPGLIGMNLMGGGM
jgi:ABC-2 type transport system permease protein